MIRVQAIQRALVQRFSRYGWQRITVRWIQVRHIGWRYGVVGPGEVWQLQSTQPPQGLNAYLLFTSDRFDGSYDRLRIYDQPPEDLGYINNPWDGWILRRRWRDYFPALFAELARIRGGTLPESTAYPLPWGLEARMQLLHKLSGRQVRLFTCACLRRFGYIVEKERNQLAIETMEQYADGVIAKRDMKKARKAASIPWLTSFDAREEAVSTLQAATRVLTKEHQKILDDLLSDVSGNLDSVVSLRPSWLRRNGGIVATIAQAIYADQSFAALPILADALEEAGCDNVVILNHCRTPGEHARGCWVLDLLLGKS